MLKFLVARLAAHVLFSTLSDMEHYDILLEDGRLFPYEIAVYEGRYAGTFRLHQEAWDHLRQLGVDTVTPNNSYNRVKMTWNWSGDN